MGQLADAIHQLRDFLSKLGADILFVDARIFNHVVEECRHQALASICIRARMLATASGCVT